MQACRQVLEESSKELQQINIYDVYEDICLPYVYQELKQMAKTAAHHPAMLGAHLVAGELVSCSHQIGSSLANRCAASIFTDDIYVSAIAKDLL